MRRVVAVVLVLACALGATLTLAATAGAGEEAAPVLTPDQRRARAKTTAWIVTWDHDRVLASLRANPTRLGRISPYWFRLKADGTRVENRDARAMDRDVLAVASASDIDVVPTVTNEYDEVRVAAALATARTRARHVTQLVNLAANARFTGIDLDYENVAPADRQNFTSFVDALARALHARDRTLSVSVPPMTDSSISGYDLAAIGADADEVRVLAYDYSPYCGGAGPIAPIDWVRRVLEHTINSVPRRKVVLGVPLYGYDWPPSGCAISRTWRDTNSIRVRRSGALAWSVPWASRRMRYTTAGGQRRIAWYEDSRSTTAKAKLVEELRIRGVALWRIGGEDPRTWSALEAELGPARG
jgi:spore germination protein YaaH